MVTVRMSIALRLFPLILLTTHLSAQVPTVDGAKQGFLMRLQLDNRGSFGRVAYVPSAPLDSLGMEYPLGSLYDRLTEGGIWIGGLLDTSVAGGSPAVPLVSVSWEGWAGPMREFFPGSGVADTIWQTNGRNEPEPVDWSTYWGSALAYHPISDNDFYSTYTDTGAQISGHVPLRLKVIQSSFVWADAYAEGIHILEYRIMNTGARPIDSAYVAFLVTDDPYDPFLYTGAFYGLYRNPPWIFWQLPCVEDGYPTALVVVGTSRDPDSLRVTFATMPGPVMPTGDEAKYRFMSSGTIEEPSWPMDPWQRVLLSLGPFILPPAGGPTPDTLRFAIALVAGPVPFLATRVARAQEIYLNRGLPTGVSNGQGAAPETPRLLQNFPNPFNSTSNVEFRISKSAWVALSVFDVLGRKVATLVDAPLEAGTHAVTFDAGHLASGVYLYRLEAGGFAATRAMMLLR